MLFPQKEAVILNPERSEGEESQVNAFFHNRQLEILRRYAPHAVGIPKEE
jgi:hypothetical protein